MLDDKLKILGTLIAHLRIQKDLKQSELAFEAGLSERVLQRIEAGHVVKSDGLVKVLVYLGVFEDLISVLSAPQISPSALAKQAKRSGEARVRKRIRRKASADKVKEGGEVAEPGVGWIWPEDQP
jgi:transcriptional regulator with XRE-family HTH domain